MKLMFKDLPCYRCLSKEQKEHKLYSPGSAFDLSRLPPTDIRNDFAAFIYDRSASLSFLSLRAELTNFHNLADFINDTFPEMQHLTDLPLSQIEKRLRVYLLMNEEKLSYERHRTDIQATVRRKNPSFYYLRTAYSYFLPHEDHIFDFNKDIWKRDTFNFPLRASPIYGRENVNFTRISQEGIKKEAKTAALYNLKRLAFLTVTKQIRSINDLSEYLSKDHPQITSLSQLDRETLEGYMSYIFLESDRHINYRGLLADLKSILNTIGKLCEYDNLRGIFLKSDFPKARRTIYKSYSDAELSRIHDGYKILDKQTARLLLIHELLGLRISDTLCLKAENVSFTDDPHIKICQQKTGNTIIKKINPEIAALLSASIDETKEAYGFCEYIFASDTDPEKPISYQTIRYRLQAMIHTLDLRDDNGKPLSACTHIFRHTYGKKLCDLNIDDSTIAALLGHKSVSSVSYYRQMSPKVMADAVKPAIDKRNEKIKQFKKGWML